jgi:AbrB family looped-hinge helix DNA binding protein
MNIESCYSCMKIGERGQVTIPKDIRDRFGLGPDIDVEFHVENDSIVLRKAPRKLEIERWRGRCRASIADLGCGSVDEFMEDVRGR